jgi:pimeloyl-ACP methyl ester carboxylesterase
MTTLTIKSKDGTLLSCTRRGKGSPLALVHGAGNYSARWDPIIPLLEDEFSIYALDRRGRGGSGDADHYSLEREFEDVVAVVDSIDEPADVLGHSLGGICAVEAALRTSKVRKLILYEPPIPVSAPLISEETLDRLDKLLKAGDFESVLTTVMLEVIKMPGMDVENLRKSPTWKDRVAIAHTLPRELRAANTYRLRGERFRDLSTPTLLMLGGNSPPMFKEAIDALALALPRRETVILAGQQHIAIDTAPALFAHEVRNFLMSPSV